MTDFDVLDAFDRCLDPLVPTAPLPADLVRRGAVARRRRTAVRAALGASAAVVLVAASTFLLGGTSQVAVPEPAVVDSPTVPDGFRLVGLGDVAVAVPASWVPTQGCRGTLRGGITFAAPAAADGCTGDPVVHVSEASATDAPGDDAEQHGLRVRLDDQEECPARALCLFVDSTTVAAVDDDVRVLIGGPEDSDALRRQIAATVQPMPAGMTAVPDVALPTTYGEACQAVTSAGFVIGPMELGSELCGMAFDGSDTVRALTPAPGTVVPLGSEIFFYEVGAQQVSFGGIVLDVPETWTPGVVPCGRRGTRAGVLVVGEPGPDRSCTTGAFVEVSSTTQGSGYPAGSAESVNDLERLRRDECPPDAFCVFDPFISIGLPDLDLSVFVTGAPEQVLEEVVASIRAVPEGMTTVPDVVGTSPGKAAGLLEQVGLRPVGADGLDPLGKVGRTEPRAHQVVPLGSPVRLLP